MNIYITADSLRDCALNLDNVRLRNQTYNLKQIIYNIVHLNSDIVELINNVNPYMLYSGLAKNAKDLKHSSTQWANKSPLHVYFIVSYFNYCYEEQVRRAMASTPGDSRIRVFTSALHSILMQILPIEEDTLKCMGFTNKGLYRNIPEEFDKETDTIKAYQQYLIKQWKEDLSKNHAYLINRAKSETWTVQPRAPRRLVWSRVKGFPTFAHQELTAYKETLNAKTNTA